MKKRMVAVILTMLCGISLVGCGGSTGAVNNANNANDIAVSLEEIYAANQISKILEEHNSVEMKTELFVMEDETEGSYLGYHNMVFVQDGEVLMYRSEAAAQSVPVIEEASNQTEPTCVFYSADDEMDKEVSVLTQDEYESFLNSKWMTQAEQDVETIVAITEGEEQTLTVTTVRTYTDGTPDSDVVYTLDAETLEIQAIETIEHTETDYGDILYRTNISYGSVTEDQYPVLE